MTSEHLPQDPGPLELPTQTSNRHRSAGRVIRDIALGLSVLATIGVALLVAVVHIHFMRVISPSMEPAVRVGNVVVLKPISTMNLVEGQVVILPVPDEGGVMYAHRLISVREVDGKVVVTTKGDANPAADPWELQIESASVPLVVGQIPVPGVFAGLGGRGMTQLLAVLLLALIAAPMMMGMIRRMRAGTRLRALPLRLSDRRRR